MSVKSDSERVRILDREAADPGPRTLDCLSADAAHLIPALRKAGFTFTTTRPHGEMSIYRFHFDAVGIRQLIEQAFRWRITRKAMNRGSRKVDGAIYRPWTDILTACLVTRGVDAIESMYRLGGRPALGKLFRSTAEAIAMKRPV